MSLPRLDDFRASLPFVPQNDLARARGQPHPPADIKQSPEYQQVRDYMGNMPLTPEKEEWAVLQATGLQQLAADLASLDDSGIKALLVRYKATEEQAFAMERLAMRLTVDVTALAEWEYEGDFQIWPMVLGVDSTALLNVTAGGMGTMCIHARHDFVFPNGVVDLQKGERYDGFASVMPPQLRIIASQQSTAGDADTDNVRFPYSLGVPGLEGLEGYEAAEALASMGLLSLRDDGLVATQIPDGAEKERIFAGQRLRFLRGQLQKIRAAGKTRPINWIFTVLRAYWLQFPVALPLDRDPPTNPRGLDIYRQAPKSLQETQEQNSATGFITRRKLLERIRSRTPAAFPAEPSSAANSPVSRSSTPFVDGEERPGRERSLTPFSGLDAFKANSSDEETNDMPLPTLAGPAPRTQPATPRAASPIVKRSAIFVVDFGDGENGEATLDPERLRNERFKAGQERRRLDREQLAAETSLSQLGGHIALYRSRRKTRDARQALEHALGPLLRDENLEKHKKNIRIQGEKLTLAHKDTCAVERLYLSVDHGIQELRRIHHDFALLWIQSHGYARAAGEDQWLAASHRELSFLHDMVIHRAIRGQLALAVVKRVFAEERNAALTLEVRQEKALKEAWAEYGAVDYCRAVGENVTEKDALAY
ncbi:hypothetical protein HMN09_00494700 [Mycena chlorophos]|uniref:Uncharacterized protein n=1 Tax=Mycena chlorophos TaxID=658473 RepID=A0A8H6WID8_MYCCL|nr:hypothetical protein HMN09_00494700 [Mycena chlorophos]